MSGAELVECEFTYTQEMHCCGPKVPGQFAEPELKIRTADGGGGFYIVVSATEWAIDPEEGESQIAALQRVAKALGV